MRGAQYVLPAGSTVYLGCVGKDKFANTLREANEKEGLKSEYMVVDSVPTGKCAVLINGHSRSMVTDLSAANDYKLSHLKSPAVWKLVENSRFYYVEGYHLTVCVDAIKALGEEAASKNKVFSMNLSAPFLAYAFKDQMDSIQEYWDFLIGNKEEALAYADTHGLKVLHCTKEYN